MCNLNRVGQIAAVVADTGMTMAFYKSIGGTISSAVGYTAASYTTGALASSAVRYINKREGRRCGRNLPELNCFDETAQQIPDDWRIENIAKYSVVGAPLVALSVYFMSRKITYLKDFGHYYFLLKELSSCITATALCIINCRLHDRYFESIAHYLPLDEPTEIKEELP